MVAQAVEAVWVWYVGDATFKAIYGRFPADSDDRSWTKNYLQVSGKCRDLLDEKFPIEDGTDRAEVTYRWPSDEMAGFIMFSSDRDHLSWPTNPGPPPPWRLHEAPTADGPQSLRGNPNASTRHEANAILTNFKALNIDAYLVAVKLRNERDVLHLRAYIKDPPTGLGFANLDLLPASIREVALKATSRGACSSIDLAGRGASLAPDDVAEIIAQLDENPNVLLTGPPGTGKTVLLERLARYVENPGAGVSFDPDENHGAWPEGGRSLPGKVRTVVFHPAYSYENLMLGLLPTPGENGVKVVVATGPLVNLAHYASTDGNRALLILDEFNRGNAAAILGDALALLDRDKRGNATIDLPYGELGIEVPEEFASTGGRTVDPRFTLPPNLWIVAAMNSSDRSVAPLDAALRRRFSIRNMPPDYDVLGVNIGASSATTFTALLDDWAPGDAGRLAVDLLRAINDRIDSVLGQDYCLGQSNFWHVGADTNAATLDLLRSAWDSRIVPTLRLALQDNDDSLAAILCAGDSGTATTSNDASAAWWKAADDSLGAYGQPRLHFNLLADLAPEAALSELIRLAGK